VVESMIGAPPCRPARRPHMLHRLFPRGPSPMPTMQTSAPNSALSFDVTDADFEARRHRALDAGAGAAGLLGALVRPLQARSHPCSKSWCRPTAASFVLAKLNSDDNPRHRAGAAAAQHPAVFLLKGGQVVDQFTGALPEGQVRAFLEQAPQARGRPGRGAARAGGHGRPRDRRSACCAKAWPATRAHVELTLDLADRVLARGALDDAQALLDDVPEAGRNGPPRGAAQAHRRWLRNKPAGRPRRRWRRALPPTRSDHEARFALAAIHAYEGDFNAA
jgi:putative thioredoxin